MAQSRAEQQGLVAHACGLLSRGSMCSARQIHRSSLCPHRCDSAALADRSDPRRSCFSRPFRNRSGMEVEQTQQQQQQTEAAIAQAHAAQQMQQAAIAMQPLLTQPAPVVAAGAAAPAAAAPAEDSMVDEPAADGPAATQLIRNSSVSTDEQRLRETGQQTNSDAAAPSAAGTATAPAADASPMQDVAAPTPAAAAAGTSSSNNAMPVASSPAPSASPQTAAATPSASPAPATATAASKERPAPLQYRLNCSSCDAIISFAYPSRLVHCMVCGGINAVSLSRAVQHSASPGGPVPNPLPGLGLKEQALHWTTMQVVVFLRSLKLDHLGPIFEANHIDGYQLLDLSYYDVRDILRIQNNSDIEAVLNCIAILRGAPVPTPMDKVNAAKEEEEQKQRADASDTNSEGEPVEYPATASRAPPPANPAAVTVPAVPVVAAASAPKPAAVRTPAPTAVAPSGPPSVTSILPFNASQPALSTAIAPASQQQAASIPPSSAAHVSLPPASHLPPPIIPLAVLQQSSAPLTVSPAAAGVGGTAVAGGSGSGSGGAHPTVASPTPSLATSVASVAATSLHSGAAGPPPLSPSPSLENASVAHFVPRGTDADAESASLAGGRASTAPAVGAASQVLSQHEEVMTGGGAAVSSQMTHEDGDRSRASSATNSEQDNMQQ